MEWIKVKDKLPEYKKIVILYGEKYSQEPFVGYLRKDGQFRDIEIEDHEIKGEITHWMPLPEIPKD